MWILKTRLKHPCILGDRCEKFQVVLQSYNLNETKEKGEVLTSSLHQMIGSQKNIDAFVVDLKKDKRTKHVEVNGKTLFLVESALHKPVSQFSRKMFFVKPVVIDTEGYEHWEIASWKKEELMKFISHVKSSCTTFVLLSLKNVPLKEVYFPKVLPFLTEKQKQALELAVFSGYYDTPKRTNLRALAKRMRLSLATYQKHLQKAEAKVMPDILSYLK